MFKTFAKAIQSLSVALLMGLPMASSAQQLSENASIVVESPWARASLGMSRPGLSARSDRGQRSALPYRSSRGDLRHGFDPRNQNQF